MGNAKLNKEDFENELIPLFKKVYFSSNEPFLIPYIEDITEYNHFFNIFYHASIYKHLCFYRNLDLNYDEYIRLYNSTINTETYDGFTYVNYFSKPILKVGIYEDKEGYSEAIYPLDEELVDKDVKALKLIENQEKNLQKYEKNMEDSREGFVKDDRFSDFE